MISKNSARHACLIAAALDARGIVVKAEAGTPLNELIVSQGLRESDVVKDGTYTPNEEFIVQSSNGFGAPYRGEMSSHSIEMDNILQVMVPQLRSHLQFARNVVKPLVSDLADALNAKLANQKFDAEEGIEVKQYSLPSPLLEYGLYKDIEKFSGQELNAQVRSLGLAQTDVTAEQILGMLKTGQKALDADIQTWAASKGEVFLLECWNTVFGLGSVTSINEYFSKGDAGVDACLLSFLLGTYLESNIPENTGVSLGAYSASIMSIKQQAAIRLTYAFQEWEDAKKISLLVRSMNNNRVEVYSHVYHDWMDTQGGNNALLIASLVSGMNVRMTGAFTEKASALMRAWDQYSAMKKLSFDNNRFAVIKQLTREAAYQVITENPYKVFGHLPGYAADAELLKQEFCTRHSNYPEFIQAGENIDARLSRMTTADTQNLYHLCQELIAQEVFYYTDSYKILRGIDIACEVNPDLDVKEAALLSLIELCTDFGMDQVTITGI